MELLRLNITGGLQKVIAFVKIGGALGMILRITFNRERTQEGGVAGSHMGVICLLNSGSHRTPYWSLLSARQDFSSF